MEGDDEDRKPVCTYFGKKVVITDCSLKTDDSIVTDAVVRYDGHVTWIRPIIYTVTSRHEFRGNSWSAVLKFASWTYDASLLDLQPLPDILPFSLVGSKLLPFSPTALNNFRFLPMALNYFRSLSMVPNHFRSLSLDVTQLLPFSLDGSKLLPFSPVALSYFRSLSTDLNYSFKHRKRIAETSTRFRRALL